MHSCDMQEEEEEDKTRKETGWIASAAAARAEREGIYIYEGERVFYLGYRDLRDDDDFSGTRREAVNSRQLAYRAPRRLCTSACIYLEAIIIDQKLFGKLPLSLCVYNSDDAVSSQQRHTSTKREATAAAAAVALNYSQSDALPLNL